jgi:hypothetical protein
METKTLGAKLDPRCDPGVVAAKQRLATVKAEQKSLAKRQAELWEAHRGNDALAALVADRDLRQIEPELMIANRLVKVVEEEVRAALQAATAVATREWEITRHPLVEQLFDALVVVATVVKELHAVEAQTGAVGVRLATIVGPQFEPANVADRIALVCREVGLSPDRWLPLD